jgi:dimethylhistidine N-methyltransferase
MQSGLDLPRNSAPVRDLPSQMRPIEHVWMIEEDQLTSIDSMSSSLGSAAVNVNKISRELFDFARDVRDGLSAPLKFIPSRWLYDEQGSSLFSKITRLPEYYPTERELEIFSTHASSMAKALTGDKWKIVELGAGDGRKTEILLRSWQRAEVEFSYAPIDVSPSALDELCKRLSVGCPGLSAQPRVGENLSVLRELSGSRVRGEKICVLFMGSSIGNCAWEDVENFLADLRATLMPGDLVVIGFDLIKDSKRLIQAYDDSQGVTRDFNLNLLRRMNRELGANFQLDQFRHEASWNPGLSGMESWLVSLRDQVVDFRALNTSFKFRRWEPIRTEISLKFSPEVIDDLACANGFAPLARYEDRAGDFTDAIWEATDAFWMS